MLFHRCAESNAGGGGPARGNRPYTVDLHCHVIAPGIERLVAARPEKAAEMAQLARGMGSESVDHNNKVMLPQSAAALTDLSVRLADMDRMGVDLQVVSPLPTQYYYWAE